MLLKIAAIIIFGGFCIASPIKPQQSVEKNSEPVMQTTESVEPDVKSNENKAIPNLADVQSVTDKVQNTEIPFKPTFKTHTTTDVTLDTESVSAQHDEGDKPGELSKNGGQVRPVDSDLKTDATFWFRRSYRPVHFARYRSFRPRYYYAAPIWYSNWY